MPRKARSTGWLNQPFQSGGRLVAGASTCGGVRSSPIQTFFVMLVPGQSTLQVLSMSPSAVKAPVMQPLRMLRARIPLPGQRNRRRRVPAITAVPLARAACRNSRSPSPPGQEPRRRSRSRSRRPARPPAGGRRGSPQLAPHHPGGHREQRAARQHQGEQDARGQQQQPRVGFVTGFDAREQGSDAHEGARLRSPVGCSLPLEPPPRGAPPPAACARAGAPAPGDGPRLVLRAAPAAWRRRAARRAGQRPVRAPAGLRWGRADLRRAAGAGFAGAGGWRRRGRPRGGVGRGGGRGPPGAGSGWGATAPPAGGVDPSAAAGETVTASAQSRLRARARAKPDVRPVKEAHTTPWQWQPCGAARRRVARLMRHSEPAAPRESPSPDGRLRKLRKFERSLPHLGCQRGLRGRAITTVNPIVLDCERLPAASVALKAARKRPGSSFRLPDPSAEPPRVAPGHALLLEAPDLAVADAEGRPRLARVGRPQRFPTFRPLDRRLIVTTTLAASESR